jgi:7-carboxy-7-deazaguanine synthase
MLRINEVFNSIQTEGPFAGTPATFIRLAGCNKMCSFCDTDHASVNPGLTAESCVIEVAKANLPLVVITGGEPLLQATAPLVLALMELACVQNIQYETNGSLPPDPDLLRIEKVLPVHFVVSPKGPMNSIIRKLACAFKILVDDASTLQSVSEQFQYCTLGCQYSDERVIYLSPVFTENDPAQNTRNINKTVELCLKTGFNFSLQYHKLINIQ